MYKNYTSITLNITTYIWYINADFPMHAEYNDLMSFKSQLVALQDEANETVETMRKELRWRLKKKKKNIKYFRYTCDTTSDMLIEGKSIPFLILSIVKINSNPILYPCLLTIRPPPSSPPRTLAVFADNCDERELVNRRAATRMPRGVARSETILGLNFNEVLSAL